MSENIPLPLRDLAQAAGLEVEWHDASGRTRTVAADVLSLVLSALDVRADTPAEILRSMDRLRHEREVEIPSLVTAATRQSFDLRVAADLQSLRFHVEFEGGGVVDGEARRKDARTVVIPGMSLPGYHELWIGGRMVTVAVAPPVCFSLADAIGKPAPREWALAAQLYGLRRHGGLLAAPGASGGVGDFTALAELTGIMARRNATAIAISPVHAMFSADPTRYSPYSPSSRLFINVLYIDPAEVFGQPAVGLAISALGLGDIVGRLEKKELIDWPGVAKVKLTVLRRLFDQFPRNVGSSVHEDFLAFRRDGGRTLEDHARFEALQAWHSDVDGTVSGWRSWPAVYQHPDTPEVAEFAARHAADVSFHAFLQWLAARGLARAQGAARAAGMHVGIITDLAVGTDPSGSHAWSRQGEILAQLSPGAPPDTYNELGQAWGLTSFSPRALRRNGYRAFIEMLRASLRHAGGVRIDHAMGLARMWLVPQGSPPTDGAYVHYPFDDMMRLLALESWRHRAIVIGENLGTVPDGFNDRIAEAGMLGMDVLWFTREHMGEEAGFRPPSTYRSNAIAMTTTHDLPTVAGWWAGRDLEWRERLKLFGPETSPQAQKELRGRDRERLWQAMGAANPQEVHGDVPPPDQAPIAAVLGFVGSTPAPLVIVPIEDLIDQVEQPNLPGTVDTHPNWQRRIPIPVGDLLGDPGVERRLKSLLHAREQS